MTTLEQQERSTLATMVGRGDVTDDDIAALNEHLLIRGIEAVRDPVDSRKIHLLGVPGHDTDADVQAIMTEIAKAAPSPPAISVRRAE